MEKPFVSPEADAPTSPDPEKSLACANIDTWVDRFGDSLFRYALAKTADTTTAEDLVQETFLAAISGKQRFRNDATVSTWLFAILKRKVADHYRRAGRRRENSGDSSENCEENRVWNQDPAAIYEDREFWNTFDHCIEKLPNKLSEVYILREVNQHSPQEIREMLGISATNLSMRLHRCRLALRDCLQRNWFVEDD